jgi:hypothetical protein
MPKLYEIRHYTMLALFSWAWIPATIMIVAGYLLLGITVLALGDKIGYRNIRDALKGLFK